MSRHILVKFQNSEDKKKNARKASRKKSRFSYQKTSQRQYHIPGFSVKGIFKVQ